MNEIQQIAVAEIDVSRVRELYADVTSRREAVNDLREELHAARAALKKAQISLDRYLSVGDEDSLFRGLDSSPAGIAVDAADSESEAAGPLVCRPPTEEEVRQMAAEHPQYVRPVEETAAGVIAAAAAKEPDPVVKKRLGRMVKDLNGEPPSGKCRVCGCTEQDCRLCIERTGEPCSWATPAQDLCTACLPIVNAELAAVPGIDAATRSVLEESRYQHVRDLSPRCGPAVENNLYGVMTKAKARKVFAAVEVWIVEQLRRADGDGPPPGAVADDRRPSRNGHAPPALKVGSRVEDKDIDGVLRTGTVVGLGTGKRGKTAYATVEWDQVPGLEKPKQSSISAGALKVIGERPKHRPGAPIGADTWLLDLLAAGHDAAAAPALEQSGLRTVGQVLERAARVKGEPGAAVYSVLRGIKGVPYTEANRLGDLLIDAGVVQAGAPNRGLPVIPQTAVTNLLVGSEFDGLRQNLWKMDLPTVGDLLRAAALQEVSERYGADPLSQQVYQVLREVPDTAPELARKAAAVLVPLVRPLAKESEAAHA